MAGFFVLTASRGVAFGEGMDACKPYVDKLRDASGAITAKYKQQFDQLSADAAAQGQKIKDDAPEPSTGGGILKFDIKVTSHDQEFIFGTPSVTMRTQSIKMDVPEVGSHRVEWSWDVPEFGSHEECINKPPELVCHGWDCHFRGGGRACTSVPDVTMKTHSASMDVPDVTMKTQELKFDLPEFSMEQQRIVLTIPDFTLVNVSAEMQKTQDDSEALKTNTQQASDSLTKQMKADIKAANVTGLQSVFGCYEEAVSAERDKALVEIDNNISSFQSKAQTARDQKNDAVAKSIDASIATLVAVRAQTVSQFDAAISELHKKRDETITASAGQ
jgi:hypothetical protein